MQPNHLERSRDLDRWTDDPGLDACESAWAWYLARWGAWIVGHHSAGPVDPAGTEDAALAGQLLAARRMLGETLASLDRSRLDRDDAAALANVLSSLPDLDAWAAPLDGVTFKVGLTAGSPGPGDDDVGAEGAESAEVAALRRSTVAAWGAAMAGLRVDGERLDRLTVTAQLGREEDPRRRRRLFGSMAPAWAVLDGPGGPDDPDGPYRRLLRASAERWRRSGSPIAANAAALGIDPEAVEPALRAMLATFRRVAMPAALVEPWDYRYVTGGLARRLDPALPLARLRPINDAHLASIGADPVALRIHYDIHPRPGRPVIPTAFTVSVDIARRTVEGWRAATPWVFATYTEGGLGNLEELLHESGHALHYAALRARPAHFAWPAEQMAFVEAIADVVGWTVHEPAFLEQHVGATATIREAVVCRYANVMLDACWTLFELELHRHPDRAPNDAWAEIVERDLGVAGHPEWSWWAGRGQLIDGPGYLANYALGAIMVAAVRARIRELHGDWATGAPAWYGFVSDRLLRFAGARAAGDVLHEFLGGPLTTSAILEDIERAG